MAFINQRYKVVITDDLSTDPSIMQEVNYTNSNYDSHVVKTITADSSGDGLLSSNTPVELISESSSAGVRYVVIQSTKKLRMYTNFLTVPVPGADEVSFSATFMVLDGNINNLWAVNTDTAGNAAHIKVIYVY